jgi:hypothetical protein
MTTQQVSTIIPIDPQGQPQAPQPVTIQTGPEGGNNGGWERSPHQEEQDAPIKAGEPLDAPVMARPRNGREDEEGRNKRQPQEQKGEPTHHGEGEKDENGATAATVALLRRRIEQALTTIDQRRAGPENDDEPSEAPMKVGEPTSPNYGEPTCPLFAQARPTFDPEDDDAPLMTYNVTKSCNAMQAQINEPDPEQRRIIPIDFDGWLTILQCPGQRPEDDGEDGNPRPVILPPAPTSPTTGGAVVLALQQRPAITTRFPLPHMPSGGVAILLAVATAAQQTQAQRRGASPLLATPDNGSGQNWHPYDHIVFDDPNEEFVFPVLPVEVGEDDKVHTPENSFCCGDSTCWCAASEEAVR